jgi:hypothetical protein
VPGDDLVLIADQHRVGEAELLDAGGDLPDLLLGMDTGILGEGPQACDRHRLKSLCFRAKTGMTHMRGH